MQNLKQRIPLSQKTKKWRIENVRRIVDLSVSNEFYEEIERMDENYKIINSQFEKSYYNQLCKNLNMNESQAKIYVQAYNKCYNTYATLKGEEKNRPFNFSIINLSNESINEITVEQEADYKEYIDNVFRQQSEMFNARIQSQLDPNSNERQLQEAQADIAKKYEPLLDIERLKRKYKNKLTAKELTINRLVNMMIARENIDWVKNECFSDAITVSKEFVEIYIDSNSNLPKIRQLNPMNVFCYRAPDTAFIQYSEEIGYKERMTVNQIIDEDGQHLDKAQMKKLLEYNTSSTRGTYGTSDKYSRRPGDPANSDTWRSKQNARIYPAGADLDPYSTFVDDGRIKAVPGSGNGYNGQVYGSGLYSDISSSNYGTTRNDYVTRYTVYWKSYAQMIKYTYTNDKGMLTEEILDDSFVIPEDANKEIYEKPMWGENKVRWVWYVDGKYNSAEKIYIPQYWKGKCVNSDIFYDIGPVEHAYQSLLNPYDVKAPIYGYIYGGRNATVTSIIDRQKPWLKLYYTIMSKLLRSLVQDKGVLTFLNILMVHEDLGLKKTLQMAESEGIIPYNPLAYSKGGAFVNTLKVAEKIDATNANVIQHYIQLLQFVENNLEISAGMSPQRLAQSGANRTATDNQRQLAHSMNITEPLLYPHDLLWEKIYQGYTEALVSCVNDSQSKIRHFLPNGSVGIIDLKNISLEDEYLLVGKNNSKDHDILQKSPEYVQSLIQNDKVNLSQFIELLQTDDLSEFKAEIRAIEYDIKQREEQAQKAQQEADMERMKLEKAAIEDAQKAKLDELYLKGAIDLEKTRLQGEYNILSYNMGLDQDEDGIPDLIESQAKYQELIENLRQKQQDLDIKAEGLMQKHQQHKDVLSNKLETEKIKAESKKEDNESKERIAKINAKAKSDSAKTKQPTKQ